jgi:hypothetical protein
MYVPCPVRADAKLEVSDIGYTFTTVPAGRAPAGHVTVALVVTLLTVELN